MKFTYTRTFELTDQQIRLLHVIIENNYIEFRGNDYDDELVSDCYILSDQRLIVENDMAWHTTFNPTELGIEIYNTFLKEHYEQFIKNNQSV